MTNKKMAAPKSSHEHGETHPNVNTGAGIESDSETPILDLQKNSHERLRIRLTEFKGHQYVDVRIFYLDAAKQYKPSNRGVSIRPNQVAQVIQGLSIAGRGIGERG